MLNQLVLGFFFFGLTSFSESRLLRFLLCLVAFSNPGDSKSGTTSPIRNERAGQISAIYGARNLARNLSARNLTLQNSNPDNQKMQNQIHRGGAFRFWKSSRHSQTAQEYADEFKRRKIIFGGVSKLTDQDFIDMGIAEQHKKQIKQAMSGQELAQEAGYGNLQRVKDLLAQGVSANSSSNGNPALVNAGAKGHTAVAEALLVARANVHATTPRRVGGLQLCKYELPTPPGGHKPCLVVAGCKFALVGGVGMWCTNATVRTVRRRCTRPDALGALRQLKRCWRPAPTLRLKKK
eukprot:g33540.t1